MKKLLSLVLSIAMVLSLAVGLSACNSSGVNLADYVTISVEGYSGAGTASYNVDYEKFAQDTKLSKQGYSGVYMAENILDTAFSYSFTQSDGLANGDEVVLNVTANETAVKEAKEEFKINLKYPTQIKKTIGADELPKATEIDVGSYIETVKFKGREGAATVKIGLKDTQSTIGGYSVQVSNEDKKINITKNGVSGNTYSYEIIAIDDVDDFSEHTEGWGDSKTYPINNGDKVKIGVKYTASNEGFVLLNTSKTYTAKGLAPLIDNPEDLPVRAALNTVKKEVNNISWLTDKKYKMVFLVEKDATAQYANRLVVRVDSKDIFLGYDDYKDVRLYIYNNVYEEDGEFKYSGDVETKTFATASGNMDNLSSVYKEYIKDDSYTATEIALD